MHAYCACQPGPCTPALLRLLLCLRLRLQVDREKERFSLTLKQSICGAPDAAYLASLFRSDLFFLGFR